MEKEPEGFEVDARGAEVKSFLVTAVGVGGTRRVKEQAKEEMDKRKREHGALRAAIIADTGVRRGCGTI